MRIVLYLAVQVDQMPGGEVKCNEECIARPILPKRVHRFDICQAPSEQGRPNLSLPVQVHLDGFLNRLDSWQTQIL